MHVKNGARIAVDTDSKHKAVLRKAQRDSHAFRLWQQDYADIHACAASRAIERSRIQESGHAELHCDFFCGSGYVPEVDKPEGAFASGAGNFNEPGQAAVADFSDLG